MDTKSQINEYLKTKDTMQLATVANGQPWLCTVHFVHDDDLNMYWLSIPERRHSKHIADDSKTAIAVAVKTDKPVIGIQAAGLSVQVSDLDEISRVMKLYSAKHEGSGKDFVANYMAGTNEHQLYKFAASEFGLFDEMKSPGKGRQELQL